MKACREERRRLLLTAGEGAQSAQWKVGEVKSDVSLLCGGLLVCVCVHVTRGVGVLNAFVLIPPVSQSCTRTHLSLSSPRCCCTCRAHYTTKEVLPSADFKLEGRHKNLTPFSFKAPLRHAAGALKGKTAHYEGSGGSLMSEGLLRRCRKITCVCARVCVSAVGFMFIFCFKLGHGRKEGRKQEGEGEGEPFPL